MRAPETTDRLRNDGGAWLRLYDERVRFFDRSLHARLLAAAPGRERDLVKLRRTAGLSELPFYCVGRLETDDRGRELYDNRATRHLDYYVPDGAPAADDAYAATGTGVAAGGVAAGASPPRPAPPVVVGLPHRVLGDVAWSVVWRPGDDTPVDGWRVELWEETADLWRYRLARCHLEAALRRFDPPPDLLRADARFAVVVWAHGEGGYSGNALATALVLPRPDNPLLSYNAVRPCGLWPDGLAAVAASGSGPDARHGIQLSWSVPEPALTQVAARVRVFEDSCLADDVAPVFEATIDGPAAAACRCRPPAAVLRPGHTYAWYVEARDATGRWCYAPSEGLFTVMGDA